LIGLLAASLEEALKHGAPIGQRRLVFEYRHPHWQKSAMARSKKGTIELFVQNGGSGRRQKEIVHKFKVSREQIRKIQKKVREGQT
jgi:hypothetical protein